VGEKTMSIQTENQEKRELGQTFSPTDVRQKRLNEIRALIQEGKLRPTKKELIGYALTNFGVSYEVARVSYALTILTELKQ
jgi:hypothetical protein